MKRPRSPKGFALCLSNADYPASLERWKIYRLVPDGDAAAHGQIRVVDESGEDYLYAEKNFKSVKLSPALVRLYGRRVKAPRGRLAIRTA